MNGLALGSHLHHEHGPGSPPSVWAHLAARVHSDRLDKELATGIPSWESPRHAARALQLTAPRHRRSLAQGLDRLLADARHPTAHVRMLCVTPCHASIRSCGPLIESLSCVLSGDLPLEAMDVAHLRVLMRNGIGPLYCGGRCTELSAVLEQISSHILAED
jgi:hypothetical protein